MVWFRSMNDFWKDYVQMIATCSDIEITDKELHQVVVYLKNDEELYNTIDAKVREYIDCVMCARGLD